MADNDSEPRSMYTSALVIVLVAHQKHHPGGICDKCYELANELDRRVPRDEDKR
jgi:hypothetical protein